MSTCALGHHLNDTQFVCPQCGMGRLPQPAVLDSAPFVAPMGSVPSATVQPVPEPTPDPVLPDVVRDTVRPETADPGLAGVPSTESPTFTPLFSPDGLWLWSGTAWLPAPPKTATGNPLSMPMLGEAKPAPPAVGAPVPSTSRVPAMEVLTTSRRTRRTRPRAALAAAVVLALGVSGVGVAAATGALSHRARHLAQSASAIPTLSPGPTPSTDPRDPDYQAGLGYANANNADWLAFYGRVGGSETTPKSDRDTDILGWCTEVDPYLHSGDESPGSRLWNWRDGCTGGINGSGAAAASTASGVQVDAKGNPTPDGFPTYPAGDTPPADCVPDDSSHSFWVCDSISKAFTGHGMSALVRQACAGIVFTSQVLDIAREPDGHGGFFQEQVSTGHGDGFYEQIYAVSKGQSYDSAVAYGQFAFLTRLPTNPDKYLSIGCGVQHSGGDYAPTYTKAEVSRALTNRTN